MESDRKQMEPIPKYDDVCVCVLDQESFRIVCGETSACPGPYAVASCPEFYDGYRLDRELFTLPSYIKCIHIWNLHHMKILV